MERDAAPAQPVEDGLGVGEVEAERSCHLRRRAAPVALEQLPGGPLERVDVAHELRRAVVAQQLILVLWGPDAITLTRPQALKGSVVIGGAVIETYRILAAALGLAVFLAMRLVLKRTRIGLLVRAGVENGEMVEALGYRIRRLFVGVFVVGSALAGLGGVMWGLYQQNVIPQMGAQVNVLIFIVIIIGGLGSTGGALIGALLVGLMANYTGFLVPKVALFSNIALMVAILLWRPQGVYPVANR